MDKHFHIWERRGKTFLMRDRPYTTRSHANKDAAALQPEAGNRMVRECLECPPSKRSKRRPVRWALIAKEVATAVGADPATIRVALREALERERVRE